MTARLGSSITQSRLVFADTNLTMKSLEFENVNSYVVAGQGNLTLAANSGNASIIVVQGSHEVRLPVLLGSNLDVTVPAGQTLTFDNLLDLNGFTLRKLGAGNLIINNLVILDGGTITTQAGSIIDNFAAVPEPASALMAVGVLAWHGRRRRRS